MTALDYTNCCQEYPGKSVPESLVCTPFCTRPWTYNKTNQDWVKWIESGGDTKYYTSECTSALTGSDNIYFIRMIKRKTILFFISWMALVFSQTMRVMLGM
jgi:hypothetical protein